MSDTAAPSAAGEMSEADLKFLVSAMHHVTEKLVVSLVAFLYRTLYVMYLNSNDWRSLPYVRSCTYEG